MNINDILKYKEYNVNKEYETFKKLDLLYKYKKNVIKANLKNVDENIVQNQVKFNHLQYDANGFEIAEDVMANYPISVEEEKELILRKAEHFDFLRKANNVSEFCRTRCKLGHFKLRNFAEAPVENQKCFTDCLNVRFESGEIRRPGIEDEVHFMWSA